MSICSSFVVPSPSRVAGTASLRPQRTRGERMAFLLAATVALALAGCGTGDPAAADAATEAAQAPPPPPPPPASAEKNDFSGSKSVLGKAMEQAHKLEDKVEAYNKKIEDAAEGKHD